LWEETSSWKRASAEGGEFPGSEVAEGKNWGAKKLDLRQIKVGIFGG